MIKFKLVQYKFKLVQYIEYIKHNALSNLVLYNNVYVKANLRYNLVFSLFYHAVKHRRLGEIKEKFYARGIYWIC